MLNIIFKKNTQIKNLKNQKSLDLKNALSSFVLSDCAYELIHKHFNM